METTSRIPPYDAEVAAGLAVMLPDDVSASISAEMISELRKPEYTAPEDLDDFDVERQDITVPGYDGAELIVSVFKRRGHIGVGVGLFHIHGGGMVLGDRLRGMSTVLPWVVEHDAVAVTVEYRLAPEYPDPYPVEDCYSAFCWLSENAAELEIDPKRLVLVGGSAGGGLAAGIALLARDRGGPTSIGQILLSPMLDDRDATRSSIQFQSRGLWDRESNRTGWRALLGDRQGGPDVSLYAAPGRAQDLSNLPATFVDVGSAEVFRDEVVSFATQMWADGGVAELHVWPGGTHGWELLAPQSRMAHQALEARNVWIARLLEP